MTLLARDIFAMTTDQVKALGPGPFTVRFEDGVELESTARKLLYSRLFWEMFKGYENTPITSRHHVDSVLKGKLLNSKTNIKLAEAIFYDICMTYNLVTPESKEHLLERQFQVSNQAYNFLIVEVEPNVTSIDLMDLIDVVRHPKMMEVNDNCGTTPREIVDAGMATLDLLRNDPDFSPNMISKALRSGMVRDNQLIQCINKRGYPIEVNGDILSTAIMTNFTEGLYCLYDYAAESRSAAKSQFLSETPIQDAEFFARRLQLLTMVVSNVSYTDCGTKGHTPWRINPPEYDEQGNKIYPGDLNFMRGKHYQLEEGGPYFTIDGTEEHLNGKIILLRSVFNCIEPNEHRVCYKCLGEMHNNINRYYNLGHISAATMTRQTTQLTLSAKHVIESGDSEDIEITGDAVKYLKTSKDRKGYVLRDTARKLKPRIRIPMDEAMGLNDIIRVQDIKEVSPGRITRITYMDLLLEDSKGEQIIIPIEVAQANRKGFLTPSYMKKLKEHSWEVDELGNFILDISLTDKNETFLMLPNMEYSYTDHSLQIAKMIESNIKDITDKNMNGGPVKVLQDLFELVNIKLFVNIAALEVIVYANSVPYEGSFALSRGAENPQMAIADQAIKSRSLGAAYAYQHTAQTITNPRNFFRLDRPDSPMDIFVTPREVIASLGK